MKKTAELEARLAATAAEVNRLSKPGFFEPLGASLEKMVAGADELHEIADRLARRLSRAEIAELAAHAAFKAEFYQKLAAVWRFGCYAVLTAMAVLLCWKTAAGSQASFNTYLMVGSFALLICLSISNWQALNEIYRLRQIGQVCQTAEKIAGGSEN